MSQDPASKSKGLPPASVVSSADLVGYQEGSIVSRIVAKQPGGTITVFAFDGGETLSEHKTPYEAVIQIVDGEAAITIAGERHAVRSGEMILLPANVPHAVEAVSRFKMILTMLKT